MGDAGRGSEAARPLEPFNPHAVMRWQCRLLLVLITKAKLAEICQSKAGMANVVTKYSSGQAPGQTGSEKKKRHYQASVRVLLEGLDIILTSASVLENTS